jgi:uncharacterized spore protein YtfJ
MGERTEREVKSARSASGTPATKTDGSSWDASELMKHTVAELQEMLDTKHVIGEPMTFGSTTVVPLVSVGFGFGGGGGGGGGTSSSGERGEGGGSGGGGGGGIKPIAVLIIEDGAVRLEPIPEAPSGLDKLGAAVAGALTKKGGEPDAASEG